MNSTKIIIVLAGLLSVACYMLGKKQGSEIVQQQVVNNVQLVKEMASLATLEINGSTSVSLSNISNQKAGWMTSLKKYLTENTLQVTIPYKALYGVKVDSQKIEIKESSKLVKIILPKAGLLSMQLQLDKLTTMNQTGLFSSTSINDLATAQKQLYNQVETSLIGNVGYIQQAQTQVKKVIEQYYKPFGFQVEILFQ